MLSWGWEVTRVVAGLSLTNLSLPSVTWPTCIVNSDLQKCNERDENNIRTHFSWASFLSIKYTVTTIYVLQGIWYFIPFEDLFANGRCVCISHIPHPQKRQLEGEHWTNNMYIAAKQARFKLKKNTARTGTHSINESVLLVDWLSQDCLKCCSRLDFIHSGKHILKFSWQLYLFMGYSVFFPDRNKNVLNLTIKMSKDVFVCM